MVKTDSPASRTINGRDFVPSRKHSQEHFSTDSTARKTNADRSIQKGKNVSGSADRRDRCIGK